MSFIAVLNQIISFIYNAFRIIWWPDTQVISDNLRAVSAEAPNYHEWLSYQLELDALTNLNAWREDDEDDVYDWQDLRRHKQALERYSMTSDFRGFAKHLRTYTSRNLCQILSPSLYRRSAASTKLLIQTYNYQLRSVIEFLALSNDPGTSRKTLDAQEKQQLFSDVRRTLGHTTLVLQGGSIFSLSHFGVVKALHLLGLLPSVITGAGTGSLAAALVATCSDEELEKKLRGESIDLSAFSRKTEELSHLSYFTGIARTGLRRVKRFIETGHFLDVSVLEKCAQSNLGDCTFREAYLKTSRILNITVALPDGYGVPQLLNYITAPHVVIWSAVVTSVATSKTMYAPVCLISKDDSTGDLQPFYASDATPGSRNHMPQDAPLKRIGELFDVNHFIVSSTRPYLIPFIRLQDPRYTHSMFVATVFRLLFDQAVHVLRQLSMVGLLPIFLHRLLMDETMPVASEWAKIVLTPELHLHDLLALFETPSSASLDKWILRGERSVWPRVAELETRCGIEFELDAAWDTMRRKLPRRRNTGHLPRGENA